MASAQFGPVVASTCATAARSRRTVSFCPSTSSDSNSGGPTDRPVTATRRERLGLAELEPPRGA